MECSEQVALYFVMPKMRNSQATSHLKGQRDNLGTVHYLLGVRDGVSGYGTRTFFNASEYGTQRFFVFLWYGT